MHWINVIQNELFLYATYEFELINYRIQYDFKYSFFFK